MATDHDADPTESAIRRYLLFVEDPRMLRDEKEIQARTQAVLDAKDPIDKLKALSDLERVATIDEALDLPPVPGSGRLGQGSPKSSPRCRRRPMALHPTSFT